MIQRAPLLQNMIFAGAGILIALGCLKAIRSHGYLRAIADSRLRYRLRRSAEVDPERVVPYLQVVFAIAAAMGVFVAIVGILSIVKGLS